MSESTNAEQLLADTAWLRRLAVTLAGNEADADDLVQESWIAAWRRQPDADRPLRPWLAKVLRDAAGMKRRSERRRAIREDVASSAVDDAGAPPDALLDQMRLHRLIVDLVLELDEPYRSTIIARFVEGRSAAAIARSAGIPESTVRGRIRDGLARLREGLDRARGERSKWAPAVLAFAKGGLQVAKPTKSLLVLLGLLLLLVGGVAVVVMKKRGGSGDHPTGGQAVAGAGAVRGSDGSEMLSPSTPAPSWFAPRNATGRRIAGRVTYHGAPVKDAIVALQSAFARANVGEPAEMSPTMQALMTHAGAFRPAEVRTGADGTFDFGMLPPSSYTVTARIEGKMAAIARVNLADPTLKPPPDALELRLKDCTASIAGTVYDASENPLPKARVLLDAVVGVETDARGAYKICVPFDDVVIEYSAEGYGAVRLSVDGRGQTIRDVVLVPEATLTVRVLRVDTGELVPDAHVNVFAQEFSLDRPAPQTGITDIEGRVRIDGLVPDRYRVTGFADGLQAFSPIEALVEVGVGTEVVLRLDATARIAGKVVDDGKPVPGARVVVARKSPATRSPPAVSQADGSFTLERVPPGDDVFAVMPYEVEAPAQLHTEAGKTYEDVVVELRRGATIRGTVTRFGKPVEGAGVCCVRTTAGLGSNAVTDAEGHYTFEGVIPGAYDVMGSSDELGAFKQPTKVSIAVGEERVVDLELDIAGTISGTVVDKQGIPVKGALVRWGNAKTGDQGSCTTDTQGRYRCGALTGGGSYRGAVYPNAYVAVAYPTADGSAYPTIDVKNGTTTIENIRIAIDRPVLALSGQVLDDAGHAVSDAIVRVLPTTDSSPVQFHSWLRLPMTSTDGDGTFRIAELAPGNYAIQARASDGAEGTVPPVAAGTKGVTIRIARAGSIEGTLVGFAQAPVIYARPIDAMKLLPGTVDGTKFRVAGMPPGRYLVNAQTTFEGDAHIVEVHAGKATKVVMTSHGQGAIDGTVLDFRTKKPIANASCHVVMAVDGEQSITNWDLSSLPKSDASGRVLLDPAPAGTVNVNCEMPGMRWSRPSADVTLAAGGRATVQLLSVDLTTDTPSSVGLDFDWRTTAPRVASVRPNSPGAKAGILSGDVITQVNGTPVQGLNGMGVAMLISSTPAGGEVRLVVQRGTATKTFTLKPTAESM